VLNVLAGSSHHVHSCFFGGVGEGFKAEPAVGVEVVFGVLDEAPVGVEADGVEAYGFDFLEDVDPERGVPAFYSRRVID